MSKPKVVIHNHFAKPARDVAIRPRYFVETKNGWVEVGKEVYERHTGEKKIT